MAGAAEGLLHVRDRHLAVVEDARREHRIGSGIHRGWEVRRRSRTTRSDHGYRDRGAYPTDQLHVETGTRAVGVHRVEKNLAGAQSGSACGPLDRVESRRPPATMRGDLESAPGRPARVDGQHEHLPAESM